MKAFGPVLIAALFIAALAHTEIPQHKCIHGSPAIEALQKQGLTKKVSTSSGRHFGTKSLGKLRIVTSTLDLYDESQYCTAAGQLRPNFNYEQVVCTEADVLTDEKRNKILELIPKGIARLAELLAVDQVLTPISVGAGACENVTTPLSHTVPGVSDADFVLYITAGPTQGSTEAWAYTCSYDDFGRPLIGQANFGPSNVPVVNSTALDTQLLNVFIHETTHALGFNTYFWQSPYWAGANDYLDATVRGHPTKVFAGAAVQRSARAYFECDSLFYVDLENEGGPGSLWMHWDRHTLQQELMAAAGGSKYSMFTLSVLEDSGHYAPYYANADVMDWGQGAGCGFVTEPCNTVAGGKGQYFCFDESGGDSCSYDNKAVGYCGVSPFTDTIPDWGQYFYDSYLGGSSNFMDYCPVVKSYQNRDCTEDRSPTDAEADFGLSFGQDSRCFATFSTSNEPFGLMRNSASSPGESGLRCLRRRCVNNQQLEVLVGSDWLQCDSNGMIDVPFSSGFTGQINCGREFTRCTGNAAPAVETVTTTPVPASGVPISDGGCSSPTGGSVFHYSGTITTDLDGVGGVRYQANENCQWTIQCSGRNQFVYISDLQLRIEDGFDFVRFETVGGTPISQYSGAYATPQVIGAFEGNPGQVTVRFVSDAAGELNGATVSFECRESTLLDGGGSCDASTGGATFASFSGVVESDIDGAGNQVYMRNPLCSWSIQCPPSSDVTISSVRGAIADDDSISISDGNSDTTFTVLTGGNNALSFSNRLTTNLVNILFQSSRGATVTGGKNGFSIYYQCTDTRGDALCQSVKVGQANNPNEGDAGGAIDGRLDSFYESSNVGPITLILELKGSHYVDKVGFYVHTPGGNSITTTVATSEDGTTYVTAGSATTTVDGEYASVVVSASNIVSIRLQTDSNDHAGDGYNEINVCGHLLAHPDKPPSLAPPTPAPTPTTCISSATHGKTFRNIAGTIITDTDGAGPNTYAPSELCSWTISCPTGATPSIDSAYGDLEQGYDFLRFINPDTAEEYLNLTGGFNWTEASGFVVGVFYDGPTNVEIQLSSDYAIELSGFTIDYTCVSVASLTAYDGILGRGSANRSSLFLGGAVSRGTMTPGTIIRGTVTRGTIIRGTVTRGTITRGTITRSGITRGTIVRGTITRGTITRGTITRGTITRGTITRGTITRGTPICETYDGVEFQCDYWGEALVAQCVRPSDISLNPLIIHARAEPPYDGANHTVITGIAIKDGSNVVSFERDIGTGEVTITLNGVIQTGNLTTGEMYVIQWPDASIEIYSFVDYSKVVINVYPNTMAYATILSEYCMDFTFGLIGNFDIDPYNDFQSLDLSTVLPIDAPQSDIYHYFVLSYLVTDDSMSLFPVFTAPHLDFVPQFVTDDMIFDCPAYCNFEAGCCYSAAVAGPAVASEDPHSLNFQGATSGSDICTTVLDTCQIWIMEKCVCTPGIGLPDLFCVEYVANCLAVEQACLNVAYACFAAVEQCYGSGSPIPVPI